MKKHILLALILSFILAFCVSAAEEGDYGYYDVTADGKIEIADVMGVLRDVVNNNGKIIRAIRTLKLVTEAEVSTAIISNIDTDKNEVTLMIGSSDEKVEITVPLNKIGFNKAYDIDFFSDGFVTMTVDSEFKNSKSVDLIYAAEASFRYDTVEIKLTADSKTAIVNGETEVLDTAPFIKDGEFFVSAKFLGEKFETDFEGENVSATSDLETLGAKVTFDENSGTLVIVKQIFPTLKATNASGKAGEEIEVVVSFSHNTGVSGVQFSIDYSSSLMEFVSAKNTSNGMFSSSSAAGANPFKFVSAHLGLKEVLGDLTFTTVKFKIDENALPGTYSIGFSKVQIYDSKIYKLKVQLVPCTITVTE